MTFYSSFSFYCRSRNFAAVERLRLFYSRFRKFYSYAIAAAVEIGRGPAIEPKSGS